MRVFRECLSVCVSAALPLGFEGMIWDLIVLVRDHWFSLYFGRDMVVRKVKLELISYDVTVTKAKLLRVETYHAKSVHTKAKLGMIIY